MTALEIEQCPFLKAAVAVVAGALLLTGCVYRQETIPAAAPTTEVVPSPSTTVQRIDTYPEGRYQLYGNGTSDSPHYWVWIPTGAAAHASAPSAIGE